MSTTRLCYSSVESQRYRPVHEQHLELMAMNAFSADEFGPERRGVYPWGAQVPPTTMSGFDSSSFGTSDPGNANHGGSLSPPPMFQDGELGNPSSVSITSGPSAPSSAVGSPLPVHGHPPQVEVWHGPMVPMPSPGIMSSHDYFHTGTEYSFVPQAQSMDSMENFASYDFTETPKPHGFVDPSLIHAEINQQMMAPYENSFPQTNMGYPTSPALTASPPHTRTGSQSPLYSQHHNLHYPQIQAPVDQSRRPSIVSFHSGHSGAYSDSDSREKQRCPHNDCGKIFKDLKAHMLTHQTERPEKCPITTCEYHIKGFARKYDKNRHTLTHYKGNMVCGFCPGPGSAAEKSFNRADVFKRHLTAVHGVEQTPPNSRKNKNASSAPSDIGQKPGPAYGPGATGKCSTCSNTFSDAQSFYEHLDDCVLRVVQREDPAEAVNAMRLAEVENDKDVLETLEKNNLPATTQTSATGEDEQDEDMEDDEGTGLSLDEADLKAAGVKTSAPGTKPKGNPANGVQKSRGMTHSRGGVSMSQPSGQNKGRKHRREYPNSWGFDKSQMTMKKRVAVAFHGQRRLVKDEMMLSTEHEVRMPLVSGQGYVTDLDVQTLERTEGFHNATPAEKGLWVSDDPTEEDYKIMAEAQLM